MIYRMIPTSFDVLPKETGTYLVVYNDDYEDEAALNGKYYAYQYTVDGGWNTHPERNGEGIYTEAKISIGRMKESYKYWLRPVEVEGDSYAERLAILLDEVTAEKNDTEPTEGEEIGKFEMLDELETHIMRALEFAEEFDR